MAAPKHDEKKAQAPEAYRVAHTRVDDWAEGERLTAEQLDGIDIERLVAIGAIVPDEAAGDAPTAEPGEAVPPPSAPLPN
jgi:hypothetical protein